VGVRFTLADGAKLIRCVVTRAALETLVGRQLSVDQYYGVFTLSRERIEAIASAKYETMSSYYPPLTIKPSDLR
jgi:hypothetical protein